MWVVVLYVVCYVGVGYVVFDVVVVVDVVMFIVVGVVFVLYLFVVFVCGGEVW